MKGRKIRKALVLIVFAASLGGNIFLLNQIWKMDDFISEAKSHVHSNAAMSSLLIQNHCRGITRHEIMEIGTPDYELEGDLIYMDHYYHFGVRYEFEGDELVGISEYPKINILPGGGSFFHRIKARLKRYFY
jgi:hypothetical protein